MPGVNFFADRPMLFQARRGGKLWVSSSFLGRIVSCIFGKEVTSETIKKISDLEQKILPVVAEACGREKDVTTREMLWGLLHQVDVSRELVPVVGVDVQGVAQSKLSQQSCPRAGDLFKTKMKWMKRMLDSPALSPDQQDKLVAEGARLFQNFRKWQGEIEPRVVQVLKQKTVELTKDSIWKTLDREGIIVGDTKVCHFTEAQAFVTSAQELLKQFTPEIDSDPLAINFLFGAAIDAVSPDNFFDRLEGELLPQLALRSTNVTSLTPVSDGRPAVVRKISNPDGTVQRIELERKALRYDRSSPDDYYIVTQKSVLTRIGGTWKQTIEIIPWQKQSKLDYLLAEYKQARTGTRVEKESEQRILDRTLIPLLASLSDSEPSERVRTFLQSDSELQSQIEKERELQRDLVGYDEALQAKQPSTEMESALLEKLADQEKLGHAVQVERLLANHSDLQLRYLLKQYSQESLSGRVSAPAGQPGSALESQLIQLLHERNSKEDLVLLEQYPDLKSKFLME